VQKCERGPLFFFACRWQTNEFEPFRVFFIGGLFVEGQFDLEGVRGFPTLGFLGYLLNFEVVVLVEFAICGEGFEFVSSQDQGAMFLYTGFVAGDLLHS
jgi:hypothetical protein